VYELIFRRLINLKGNFILFTLEIRNDLFGCFDIVSPKRQGRFSSTLYRTCRRIGILEIGFIMGRRRASHELIK
jgi:hypothetical protein